MYPTILATRPFPVRIWYVHERPQLGRVESDLKCLGVVADVLVETDTPDYPYRDDDRVTWPIGRFRTSLCGPELLRAVQAGHVQHVYRSVSYTLGRPFAAAASGLLALRQDARARGDAAWESMVKSLSNAFGGKLAQIKHDWCMDPKKSPMVAWGEWDEPSRATGRMEMYRTAAGLVWQRQPHEHKGRPLASCFCYLTSYGRDLMHRFRQLIPADQLVSMDTDGIWVLDPSPAVWRQVRRAAEAEGFTLRRDPPVTSGQWYDPRHYWTTRGWILAGFREPKRLAKDLSFRKVEHHIPSATLAEGPPRRVVVSHHSTKLTTLPTDGSVAGDGWVSPRRLTHASPEPLQSPAATTPDTPPAPSPVSPAPPSPGPNRAKRRA